MSTPESNEDFAAAMRVKTATGALNRAIREATAQGLRVQAALVDLGMATQDKCDECGGTGEVLATLDEPDSDYLYERARDRRMEE